MEGRNPKKIVRSVTVSMSLGFCREVMIRMRELGYEMVAVSSPGPELDKLRDEDSFHCVEVPMERHISVFRDLRSLLRMIYVLRKEKPQLVHSMTPKAGLISMMAGRIAGVPLRVHTFTGLVWPTAAGLKRKLLMFTDKLTCAFATHVIPEGQGVLDDLRNGGITRKPMKVLGYGNVMGVDLKKFNPSAVEVNKNEKFTFLFVGRIVGDKGINELVEAFCRLNKDCPDTILRLVGPYEANLDPLQPETLETIRTNPNIESAGPEYDRELVEEYAGADCFVMPSYREGFPNTVIEAGAMGLPSIVTDINGSREIVENGRNGIIVPVRDSTALYQAMKLVLTDEEKMKSMSENARPMIASRFEKEFVQNCLIDFYKEVLN